MYIYADTPAEAQSLSSNQATLDVSQSWRFLSWTGDERAYSQVHFCSDLTIRGVDNNAGFFEREKPKACLFALHTGGFGSPASLTVSTRPFSADALITTQAYIRAASEPLARKRLAMMISEPAAVSVNDDCWLHHSADRERSFMLAPRARIVRTGPPFEIAVDSGQEKVVVDAVLERLLEQSTKDRSLMKLLRAQAKDMRKRGNSGWMSEKTMIMAVLRTMATEHYRQTRSSSS